MAATEELLAEEMEALRVLMEDPNDVEALKVRSRVLEERLERLEDRLVQWFERWEKMRDLFLSVRRERDAARDDLVNFMERQFAVEQHLEGHEDEVRLKVRASARMERDRVARALMEIIDLWRLQKEVDEEDLAEAEGSDS